MDRIEIYVDNDQVRKRLEKKTSLCPLEKGYEVLLIKPYYLEWAKSFVDKGWDSHLDYRIFKTTPLLTTVLDLFNFPLRGREQAEYLLKNMDMLSSFKLSKLLKGL